MDFDKFAISMAYCKTMILKKFRNQSILGAIFLGVCVAPSFSDEKETKIKSTSDLKKAFIDGTGQGWRMLTGEDFVNVNCHPKTWTWNGGHAFCTGNPVGVIRMKKPTKNFELVCEWMHKKHAGNSGIFAWASPASIEKLAAGKGRLPDGIEIQVLDLGYETN